MVINKILYNCCESVVYVWKSPLLPPPSPNQDVLSSVSGLLTVSSKAQGRKKRQFVGKSVLVGINNSNFSCCNLPIPSLPPSHHALSDHCTVGQCLIFSYIQSYHYVITVMSHCAVVQSNTETQKLVEQCTAPNVQQQGLL